MKLTKHFLRLTAKLNKAMNDPKLTKQGRYEKMDSLIDNAPEEDVDNTIQYLKYFGQQMTEYDREDHRECIWLKFIAKEYQSFDTILNTPYKAGPYDKMQQVMDLTNERAGRKAISVYTKRLKERHMSLPSALAQAIRDFKRIHPKNKAEADRVVKHLLKEERQIHAKNFSAFKKAHTAEHPYTAPQAKGGVADE